MTDKPVFTRREFVHTGLAIVSTVPTMPAFLQKSALAIADPADVPLTASRPGVPEDRILVVIQLSGGNDGLNTVVPYGMRQYYDARPMLAVRERDTLAIARADGIGLHPRLAPLKEMMESGMANVVQGVGYPNPNRSHFASMDIYHTASAGSGKGYGWLGRALDQVEPDNSTAMISIGKEAPLASKGKRGSAVAFENANLFRWAGADLNSTLSSHYDKINRAGVLSELAGVENEQAAFVMRTALDAQLASDRVRAAVAKAPLTPFPQGSLAGQLRMVASMIRAELPTRVYYVGMGGFDTHGNQARSHGNLLGQFAAAMKAFYGELKAMGQQNRVLSLAFSEFGRRVTQNASQGTDHGTAGPMYMFGPMVRPGLLGNHPSLTKLDRGDLIYNVDFRCVYTTVLSQWLGADAKKALGRAFKPAAVLDRKVTT